jgi:hypothetical protein
MAEVEIAGVRYRTGKLNVFEQLAVGKRIMPLLSGMGEAFSKIPRPPPVAEDDPDAEPVEAEGISEGDVWKALEPLMSALSEMKDDDLFFVVKMCMSKAHRHDGGHWARISNSAGTDFMFADIDMGVAIQVAFETIRENLEGFFGGPRQADTP